MFRERNPNATSIQEYQGGLKEEEEEEEGVLPAEDGVDHRSTEGRRLRI